MRRDAILMATYNGIKWLNFQIESILNQKDVEVKIFISDDNSKDGTFEFLNKLSKRDSRITLLPKRKKFKNAGNNFYRLIREVDASNYDFFGLSDQDDIWNLNKINNQIKMLSMNSADCISSNVIAFWSDGKERCIVKSQPQRKLDFIFESAGPGCSFLINKKVFLRLQNLISLQERKVNEIEMHDWLIYAICRTYKYKWLIDASASLAYRQHDQNVVGANYGLKALILRIKKIKSGWYRNEIIKISNICQTINQDFKVKKILDLLQNKSFISQIRLLSFLNQSRRKLTDRLGLYFLVIFFIF